MLVKEPFATGTDEHDHAGRHATLLCGADGLEHLGWFGRLAEPLEQVRGTRFHANEDLPQIQLP